MPYDSFVKFHEPSIGDEEIAAVVSVLRSGWLTTGAKTAEFEQQFQKYVQTPHALAVNSCTAGLHLALAALGIGPGDEVITTPLTFCATVNVILHVGATPVLADVGDDGNIDPAAIERAITGRTRAIIPVHLAGLPCRMDAIWKLARKHNLVVVEDAAHAVGAQVGGFAIGAGNPAQGWFSDAVAFSFYATKNLTTGEGGMVTTHNPALASEMKLLCLHGISKDAWSRYSEKGRWYYEVLRNGFKYNLPDIQSAIGIVQLSRQEEFRRTRARYAAFYHSAFKDMPEVELPPDRADCRHAWHLYWLRLNLDQLTIDRASFMSGLQQLGIGASVHFIPIPLHPAFADLLGGSDCETALKLYPRLVSLPLYPALDERQLCRVVFAVRQLIQKHRRRTLVTVAG